jgi:hypothetical protein
MANRVLAILGSSPDMALQLLYGKLRREIPANSNIAKCIPNVNTRIFPKTGFRGLAKCIKTRQMICTFIRFWKNQGKKGFTKSRKQGYNGNVSE